MCPLSRAEQASLKVRFETGSGRVQAEELAPEFACDSLMDRVEVKQLLTPA
jgi:hypothetical protein